MKQCARILSVESLGGRRLRIIFSDGLCRELTFFDKLTGSLAPLNEDDLLAQAVIHPEAGTLSWPGGLDLDPDVLYGDFESVTGSYFRLDAEYTVSIAG